MPELLLFAVPSSLLIPGCTRPVPESDPKEPCDRRFVDPIAEDADRWFAVTELSCSRSALILVLAGDMAGDPGIVFSCIRSNVALETPVSAAIFSGSGKCADQLRSFTVALLPTMVVDSAIS